MVRKGRLVLCVAVLFVAQTTVVHRFSYGYLRPDLLYLAAVFLALEADFKGALWGAFAIGLLRDLGSSGRLGASALLLVSASAALVLVRGHIVREWALTDALLTLAYVLACGLAAAVGAAALAPGPQLGELLARALGQAAFTTAISPLAYVAFSGLGVVDPSSRLLDAA